MLKGFCRFLGIILIAIVIFACVPIAIPKIIGMKGYNVISGSMEPAIKVGSVVYVKDADFEDLQEGDIIAFNSGASVVTHRIVEVNKADKLFTTKGDANDSNDFLPVAYTNVIGEVVGYTPYYGYVGAWLSEPVNKVIAAAALVLGFILNGIGTKKKSKKSGEDEDSGSKKSKGVNPKAVLALGLIIVFGSLGGFVFIFMGYQKSNNLYADLNQTYVTASVSAIKEQSWEDMLDIDFAALQQVNPDVAAWIYVEGTDISYPVMYSGDDEAYLRTTFDGASATAGSIFLEGYNLPDFSDSHNIIYGHNMRNLSMFGSLRFYKADPEYLQEHQYFQIITPEKKMRFQIFSYFDTEPDAWVYVVPYSDSEEFGSYISELLRHSYKKIEVEHELSSADKIVTLSTCSANEMRFTVHGVLVDSK